MVWKIKAIGQTKSGLSKEDSPARKDSAQASFVFISLAYQPRYEHYGQYDRQSKQCDHEKKSQDHHCVKFLSFLYDCTINFAHNRLIINRKGLVNTPWAAILKPLPESAGPSPLRRHQVPVAPTPYDGDSSVPAGSKSDEQTQRLEL